MVTNCKYVPGTERLVGWSSAVMCAERTITIELGKCTNLQSSRGDTFTAFARVELGQTSLGESSKTECKNGEYEVEFTALLKVAVNNPTSIENLIKQPLLVSVIEVLPRDKKAREEKINILGQSNIDLLPIVRGQTVISDAMSLFHPSLEQTDSEPAVLDIKISVPKPLLTPIELSKSNIMSVRIRGLYSTPDSWSPGASFPYTVTVATPKPCHEGGELIPLAITGGELKTAVDPDHAQLCGQWWWAGLPHTTMANLSRESAMIVTAVEDENGEFKTAQGVEFRRAAEVGKPRVIWNTERRTFLSPTVTSTFLKHLSQNFYWPVEVARVAIPTGGKGKKSDDEGLSFHAVSFVDLSSLLYPGVVRVCGAYPLTPFSESSLEEKTQRKHTQSVLEPIYPRAFEGPGRKSIPAGGAGAKRSGTAMRNSTASFTSPLDGKQPPPLGDEANIPAYAFVQARSYLWLEIELMHPLVAKRPPSAIAKRITEYIPPRPLMNKKVLSTEVAVSDLHNATADVADMLLAEYRELFADEIAKDVRLKPSPQDQYEDRYRRLIYHLNSSGRYHVFKEHLKHAVIQLVRLKFLNEISTKDPEKLQSFLSELYTYLMDEVHKGLAEKVFASEGPRDAPQSSLDCEDLQVFATEAEGLQKYELAEHYYKELLARDNHTCAYWYQYGVFSMRIKELDRAEQCFKQAISLDQQYVPALLLYGVCCSLDERFDEGKEFLELASAIDDKNPVTWTIRGLFYELAANTVLRDMCFEAALKLTSSVSKKTFVSPPTSKATDSGDNEETEGVMETIITEGIDDRVEEPVDEQSPGGGEATAHDETPDPANSEVSPRGGTGGEADKGSTGGGDGGGGSVIQSDAATTVPLDENQPLAEGEGRGLIVEEEEEEIVSPFISTAAYLLDVHVIKYAEMSLAHELTSPLEKDLEEEQLSVSYYITVARLHLFVKNFSEAQKYLKIATRKNIMNSNAWALLGDSYYLSGDYTAALDAYERVVEYAQPPAHLHITLLRLADIYSKNKMYEKAKMTSLRACKKSSTSIGWRGVGVACFELGQLEEAEDALSEANILNNLDPVVWAYICLVCKATGRHSEAEQAKKFAIKTGLDELLLIRRLDQ